MSFQICVNCDKGDKKMALVNPETSEQRMRTMLETLERVHKSMKNQYRSAERKQLDIELSVVGRVSELLEEAVELYEAAYDESLEERQNQLDDAFDHQEGQ